MAVLPIYSCFHPVLKKKTEPVTDFDNNLRQLVDDMFESMYYSDGIGLAANQVGVSKSIITIDANSDKNDIKFPILTMINPEIITFSDGVVDYQEGCLSVPKFYEDVTRPKSIQVKYLDLDAKEHILDADDILARVIQHEFDHLNGILFYEKLSPIRRTLAKSKLNKIKQGKVRPDYQMVNQDGKLIQ